MQTMDGLPVYKLNLLI